MDLYIITSFEVEPTKHARSQVILHGMTICIAVTPFSVSRTQIFLSASLPVLCPSVPDQGDGGRKSNTDIQTALSETPSKSPKAPFSSRKYFIKFLKKGYFSVCRSFPFAAVLAAIQLLNVANIIEGHKFTTPQARRIITLHISAIPSSIFLISVSY